MTNKELIKQLQQYDENKEVWLYHKLKGKIMPEEITSPINRIKFTLDGILLSNNKAER